MNRRTRPTGLAAKRRMTASTWRRLPLALAAVVALHGHAAQPTDLTSLGLEQLMALPVVGASKYAQRQEDIAAAVSVITRQEIKAFGWRTLDDALASLPGIHQTYDRQYAYLGTRGFSIAGDYSTRVLVTINGNRANDPLYDGGPFGRQLPLDMGLVERIEFIPGPGGAVYGQNAMFGVVNIVTRQGVDLQGTELALSYQHPQATREGRISVGRRFDSGLDLLVSAAGMRSRGDHLPMDFGTSGVSGDAVGLDGGHDGEAFVRASQGAWAFDLAYGKHLKDDPTGAYLSDPLVPGQYQGDTYLLANLQFEHKLPGDGLNLSARLFAGEEKYRSRLRYGSFFSFPSKALWRGFEARLLSTAFERHTLLLGLELQDNVRKDQQILDLVQPANDIHILATGYRAGLYAQDEWRLDETLKATLGLRFDRNDRTGTSVSPRAALIWQGHAGTTLKALYGRGHRAPNDYESRYDDGFAQVANPALRGERVDTLEFVADHRVDRDLLLRGSIYRWSMHDIVTLGTDPLSGIAQYQSGERISARGLELSGDRTWDGGARLRASVSVQHLASADGTAQRNSPTWLGRLNLSMPLPWAGLHAGTEIRYDSARTAQDGTRLGGYTVANVNLVTAALASGLEASLTVANLFDKRYAHPGADTNWQNALVQDGRSLRATLNVRY